MNFQIKETKKKISTSSAPQSESTISPRRTRSSGKKVGKKVQIAASSLKESEFSSKELFRKLSDRVTGSSAIGKICSTA